MNIEKDNKSLEMIIDCEINEKEENIDNKDN